MLLFAVASLALAVLNGCGGAVESPPEKAEPPLEVYELRGEVVRLIAADNLAVVKHEDIEGWMKAMTMEFPVKDKAEFERLSEGAQIEAKVHVRDLEYWLTDIVVKPPPSQP
jgi:protein SCO1/2